MSLYITGEDLQNFTNIDSLIAADPDALESNVVFRAKIIIDKHCFRNFEDMDTGSDEYALVQLAQKMIAERLWIQNNQDVRNARLIIGKGGSEKKGSDWSYNLGEAEEVMTEEIRNILVDLIDWDTEEARKAKLKTGRIMLGGDRYYGQEVNSRDQNTL